ncbi:hypothetical protein HY229_04255 [Candidatus Acetothermia bacterium]|nr:hypothetical protein [Candidatus Acetothermia bacterium]MBI3643297.1 hypothetical protein [Candidatus Acetothermia bacterium]
MNNDNPFKNLLFLIGAGVLLLIGILILFKILTAAVELVAAVLPWVLIGGGIYLLFRWLQHKKYGR